MAHLDRNYRSNQRASALPNSSSSMHSTPSNSGHHSNSMNSSLNHNGRHPTPPPPSSSSHHQPPPPPFSSAVHGNNPPPPLSLLSLGSSGPPPQQGPSVMQILAMGQERNLAADSVAHHPRIESLVKLGKESEATWLQIGATAETVGDLDRATVSYESALRHNAYSIVALSQIAAICRSKEEFKKAAEYFGRVVDIAPESGDVWGALGHCYLMIDDLKKAYSSYQQALYYMSNPQEPKLWYGIGILYDRYGSLEHAEEAFSSVIRMDPTFEKANEIFFRLGIIYKQQRKSSQSLECFRYILQNPPRPLTEIDIWFQIGHVYEQQKDYLAAKESYERVLVENPSHAKVLQQLGGLYHRSRAPFYNPELSVTILTKSLEADANDPFSWYLLGRAYMTTSNFGKAYEAYQQAVYRDGKNPAFWCSIGVLYYNINQFHDALDAYSRAIRIHPYLAEVWFNLGALYESCNDQMTDAIDAYQRTIQLDPTNAIVGTRLREIQNHQSTGAALSPPPTPKDISPSSLSWNYATNAGGAPSHPSGLGAELNPALNRGAGAASPPTSHRFEGPPSNGVGARPRSTEPYRNDNDRRRQSGGAVSHHSSTVEQSPPSINHRETGATSNSLPQIKSRDSQEGPPTRHSPATTQRHSDVATDNPYPPHHSLPAHFSQNSYARGPANDNDMDWDRTRRGPTGGPLNSQARVNSSSGRPIPGGGPPPPLHQASHQQPPYRRSPPNSRDLRDSRDSREPSRDYHQFNGSNAPPPPPGFERHFTSPSSGPSGSSSSGRPSNVDERDSRGGPNPSSYSTTQTFPNYSHYPPHHHGGPPTFYDESGRRIDRGREMDEEERRRTAAAAASAAVSAPPRKDGSPIRPPSVTRAREIREGSAYSTGSNPPGTPIVVAAARGRGGRSTKPRGTSITPAKPATSRSRKPKDNVEASPPARRRGAKLESVPIPSKRARGKAAAETESSTSPNPSVPQGLSREVDEDYDDGVDALMGLANSHSPSVPASSVPANALEDSALPSIPTLASVEGRSDESSKAVDIDGSKDEEGEFVNPRKRSLASPSSESGSKRSKPDTEVEGEVVGKEVEAEEVVGVAEVSKEAEAIVTNGGVESPQNSKVVGVAVVSPKAKVEEDEEVDELAADS